MKLNEKNTDYVAAFHGVRSIHKSRRSCFRKPLSLSDYSPFIQILHHCFISDCSKLRSLSLFSTKSYVNLSQFTEKFEKYYEMFRFNPLATSTSSTEDDEIITAQLRKITP